jgi:hypothetical protein
LSGGILGFERRDLGICEGKLTDLRWDLEGGILGFGGRDSGIWGAGFGESVCWDLKTRFLGFGFLDFWD